MEYDYSILPPNHDKRNVLLMLMVVVVMVILIVSILVRPSHGIALLQLLLTAGLVSMGIYLIVVAYGEKGALLRFATRYGLRDCSEAEMWSNLPLCFMGLKDNPQLINVSVRDGYELELSSGACMILFNFSYELQHGKSRSLYTYAIAVISEGRVFPHLFLDGRQNGTSFAYASNQRLSLEGDFDNYFSLYVPDGQARDALVVFTPDVMQTLVDGGRPYDIELFQNTVTIIAAGTQYRRDKLPSLLQFGSSIDLEINEKPVVWSAVDIAAALGSRLTPRKTEDSILVLWVTALLLAGATIWMSRR